MKKLLLAIVVILFTSCTTEPIKNETQLQRSNIVSTQLVTPEYELYNPYEVAQPNVILCGQLHTISTNFTSPASVFVGVYYYINLDTPYFDGTTTWTKAVIVKNDTLNTPITNQYWFGTPICDTITYFYN
jgi:hypothetical protein